MTVHNTLMPETDMRVSITSVGLLPIDKERLHATAERLNVSRSEVVRRAIEEFARNNT